jgi:hypothetical protein
MKRLLGRALAVVYMFAVALRAADPPSLKEGLWSIHTVSTNQPGDKKTEGTRSICRNHEYDERVRAQAKAQAMTCKIHADNDSGSKYESESECVVRATTIHTKGITTASGANATHTESSTTYTPAFYGISATTMIMDQKYVGACPAGMAPGDMMEADGKVIHRGKQ